MEACSICLEPLGTEEAVECPAEHAAHPECVAPWAELVEGTRPDYATCIWCVHARRDDGITGGAITFPLCMGITIACDVPLPGSSAPLPNREEDVPRSTIVPDVFLPDFFQARAAQYAEHGDDEPEAAAEADCQLRLQQYTEIFTDPLGLEWSLSPVESAEGCAGTLGGRTWAGWKSVLARGQRLTFDREERDQRESVGGDGCLMLARGGLDTEIHGPLPAAMIRVGMTADAFLGAGHSVRDVVDAFSLGLEELVALGLTLRMIFDSMRTTHRRQLVSPEMLGDIYGGLFNIFVFDDIPLLCEADLHALTSRDIEALQVSAGLLRAILAPSAFPSAWLQDPESAPAVLGMSAAQADAVRTRPRRAGRTRRVRGEKKERTKARKSRRQTRSRTTSPGKGEI